MTTHRHVWLRAIASCCLLHVAASFRFRISSAFCVVRDLSSLDNTRESYPYKRTILNYVDLDNSRERHYNKRSFLYYKNNDEDEMIADAIEPQVRLEDLPRSTMERKIHANLVKPLGTAELYIGRVAMVAAVILFSTELLTGKSLPDQIFGFLSY